MEFPNLGAFARWVLQQSMADIRPPRDSLRTFTDGNCVATTLVLFRHAPYQVELVTFLPSAEGSVAPDHRHPDIDSIEVILSGDVGFTLKGQRLLTDEMLSKSHPDGASWCLGAKIRVRPTDFHGAIVGRAGGSFLSIQRWLHGIEPSSVILNWENPPPVSAIT
jgi:hypothetical protein